MQCYRACISICMSTRRPQHTLLNQSCALELRTYTVIAKHASQTLMIVCSLDLQIILSSYTLFLYNAHTLTSTTLQHVIPAQGIADSQTVMHNYDVRSGIQLHLLFVKLRDCTFAIHVSNNRNTTHATLTLHTLYLTFMYVEQACRPQSTHSNCAVVQQCQQHKVARTR